MTATTRISGPAAVSRAKAAMSLQGGSVKSGIG